MPQNFIDRTSRFLENLGASVKSLVKIAVSGKPTLRPSLCHKNQEPCRRLIILGNGPSLRQNLDNDMTILSACHTMAVNFAANTPEFFKLRPEYYVLADPHFFSNLSDPNVSRLITSLNAVDWPMTLFVPSSARLKAGLLNNPCLKTEKFPFVAAEGFPSFVGMALSRAWAMPRPRNVLIPSIMIGAWLGYAEIYLLGADHSWLKTLSVTDENQVVTVQPHFYKEDKREEERIRSVYEGRKLHELLESFRIAFSSYHTIENWASRNGISIINATPGSMIDAFRRASLSSLKNAD